MLMVCVIEYFYLCSNYRILKFFEKPSLEETASRNASVVFYMLRSNTTQLVAQYLQEFSDTSQRTFGAFMSWLINDQDVSIRNFHVEQSTANMNSGILFVYLDLIIKCWRNVYLWR